MEVLPQASLFLGIIPALILLYYGLRGWDEQYVEKTLFIMFVLGIITGFIGSIIEILTLSAGILIVVLFPVLEQILKTMVLNLRRFHEKRSTVVYGLSFGLGFGSIFTPVSLIFANVDPGSIFSVVSILIGSIGIIFLHGATGVLIGYGVYQGHLSKFYIYTLVAHIPVTAWFFITIYYHVEQIQIGLILYGVLLYWYVLKKIMNPVLFQTKRRKRTGKSRMEQ